MKLIAISLLVVVAACDFARNVLWPTTVLCGVQEATELFTQVRGIAEKDGFSTEFADASERMLEDLAAKHGARVIACILHELVNKYTPRGVDQAYRDGQLEAVRRTQRIEAFLDERDVEFLPPYGQIE